MNLEQKIKQALEYKKGLETNLKRTEREISRLQELSEISYPELLTELGTITQLKSKQNTKGFAISFKSEKYQFSLGGDGSSQPSDEMRDGIICYISSSYFLPEEQIEIVKTVIRKHRPNIKAFKFVV